MGPSALAYSLATSLRPILRNAAQQLTLLGRVADMDDFSLEWLGHLDAYDRLSGLDLLELAAAVECLALGLGILQMVLHSDWEEAVSSRDRWRANVRLNTVRVVLRNLRRWQRENGWQSIGPH